ncbi:MAG: hypothetical protein PF541_17190 [Prolixibacteraceae bacterium]|jgi:uncharacterized protein (DUF302 family)|nr:hypothetical protein [Prolixibacteraceae bacterium]
MIKKAILFFTLSVVYSISFALSPYLHFGQLNSTTSEAIETVSNAITSNGFEIIGNYNPEGNMQLNVIAFTNDKLKKVTFNIADRGALASVLKIAIIEKAGKPNIYLLNPEYIFWAYLGDEMEKESVQKALTSVTSKITDAVTLVSTTPNRIGGNISKSDLKKYHYMFGMERFSDPVELKTFNSFAEGIKTIESNIKKGISNSKLVYKIVDTEKETAVFGIGLMDVDEGEAHFLPIIGEDHAAALPYEIILQGKKTTMLHGRYRIALHWPELTMGTFTKIMSTPGAIKDQFENLTK